tara:strand:- start:61 stop:930 length:870 start_codon:yes stop_codon:yes gene_type:complete
MNYVLILIDYLPEYLHFVVNSILSVDRDAKIYICGNTNPGFQNTEFINIEDLNSVHANEFIEKKIYSKTLFESNPLWLTSVLRVFYLERFVKNVISNDVVHFDNDILIYKSINNINSDLISSNKLNITPASPKKLIFGYSIIKNSKPLSTICSDINQIADFGIQNNWIINNGKPLNEMQFLGNIYSENKSTISLLPTLPYDSNIIFDPSNYGQYFDGTHTKPRKFLSKKEIYNQNEDIDREIKVKRIKPIFKNGEPFVLWNRRKFDLINLHIHSKRFKNYLPKEYKNYV